MAAHRFPTDIDILRPIQLSGPTQHSKYCLGKKCVKVLMQESALLHTVKAYARTHNHS